MIRQGHFMAVVRAFLFGCAVLLVVGCAGVRSEAIKQEQGRSPEATASEQARCEGTRTTVRQNFHRRGKDFLTNDLPGCPKGGLLSGTEGSDSLVGLAGDDEIRGLGDKDVLIGGPANDVIYGGPGSDWYLFGGFGNDVIHAGPGDEFALNGEGGDDVVYGDDGDDIVFGSIGADVLYGGDGSDYVSTKWEDRQPDKLYCGEGKDTYDADKNDYVDSSCEKNVSSRFYSSGDDVAPFETTLLTTSVASSASASPVPIPESGGPAFLLPAAALLLGSGILTYAILRRR